jgi:hypothetical protein
VPITIAHHPDDSRYFLAAVICLIHMDQSQRFQFGPADIDQLLRRY